MKKKKSSDASNSGQATTHRAKHPRTPTGKKADPELRASAEKSARAGTKERTGRRAHDGRPHSSIP